MRAMQVIAVDREIPEVWTLGPAVRALQAGELVVIPTDTVYGLACDPWNRQAVNRLYASKGMQKTKRCAVLCSNLKQVGAVARAVSDRDENRSCHSWQGGWRRWQSRRSVFRRRVVFTTSSVSKIQ